MQVTHTQGKSPRGLLKDYFTPETPGTNVKIKILTGLGVRQNTGRILTETSLDDQRYTNYNGAFCTMLAQETGAQIEVIYQPAVSGKHPRGLYTFDTNRLQSEEAGKGYFITHSLSTTTALDLVTNDNKLADLRSRVKGVVMIAPLTTMEEALTAPDGYKPRSLVGINLMHLFKIGEISPIPVPFWYPLGDQAWHDHEDRTEPQNLQWKAAGIVDARTAKMSLRLNSYKKSQTQRSELPCLVIGATGDRIFPVEGQKRIAENLGAEYYEIDAGHRIFTEPKIRLKPTVKKIADHFKACIEDRI